jgi:hypothetical protein
MERIRIVEQQLMMKTRREKRCPRRKRRQKAVLGDEKGAVEGC